MRYIISFIIFLFCSISLFSQKRLDTTTIVLEKIEMKVEENTIGCKGRGTGNLPKKEETKADSTITIRGVKIVGAIYNGCGVVTLTQPEIKMAFTITHENASFLGGLSTYPFRFENVNQMANTVAGVLSMDGEIPSILGARRDGTAYYINEVRVLEGFLPEIIE